MRSARSFLGNRWEPAAVWRVPGWMRGLLMGTLAATLIVLALQVTTSPAAAQDASVRPSGLAWPSGVHVANELQPHRDFGSWRGRAIDVLHTFTDNNSWGGLVNAEPYLTWHRDFYRDKSHVYVISQPPYPRNQGDNAACGRGEYNDKWQQFGQTLVNNGLNHRNTVVRIAWEFNGGFMYWSSGPTPDDFVKCWRQVATSIKTTAQHIRTDWTLNGHGWGDNLGGNMYNAYPGDDVVDIVGMDEYDHYLPAKTDAQFDERCNKGGGAGLCDLARFARQHGKQLAVGEWSVLGECSGAAQVDMHGGDNTVHIRRMAKFFYENRDILAYESYYDDPLPGNVCSALYRPNTDGSTNLQSAAEYKKWFGANTPYVAAAVPLPVAPVPPPQKRTPLEELNGKLVLAPSNKAIYYVKDGAKTWLQNSALVGCLSYRAAGSLVRDASQTLLDALPQGYSDHCIYETKPGINFVQERGSPYIWLVQPGGTMLHVGAMCVPDAYSTQHKKFRIHVVADGEVAGHTKVGSFFGTPGLCGQLPG